MNLIALEETLAELERMGRVERIDAAGVQALRSLAAALDEKPHSPGLWREYRAALSEVLEADDNADDRLSEALDRVREATVGDTSTS